jgi:hypothetical protein
MFHDAKILRVAGRSEFVFVVEANAPGFALDWRCVPPAERDRALVVSVFVSDSVESWSWQFTADTIGDAEWQCLDYVERVDGVPAVVRR